MVVLAEASSKVLLIACLKFVLMGEMANMKLASRESMKSTQRPPGH